MTDEAIDYTEWIGHTEYLEDDIGQATAIAAAAMFDESGEQFATGAELPPLWHWFYFLPKVRQSMLGNDGHPQRERNSFMPPISYPRRMFAGARLKWHQPLIVGRPARREASICNILQKSGRSGALAFVTVRYRIFQQLADRHVQSTVPHSECAGYALCLEEEQDIVYREPGPALPLPEPVELPPLQNGTWTRVVSPDTRLLFRFSALTFNAHRIHYDRTYAMSEEGYPGLVVHGPLTAMLLLQLVSQHTQRRVTSFDFRSQLPLFDLSPFRLVGNLSGTSVALAAQRSDGRTAMNATVQLE